MKALICINPMSGRGHILKHLLYIQKRLKEKYDDIAVFKTSLSLSLRSYLIDEAKNYDLILAIGGDGTLNEAISGIMESKSHPKLSYIPSGTCNDVASSLKLSKNYRKALDLVLHGSSILMDIGRINDEYFTYVAGFGQFTDISYQASPRIKKFFGKTGYYLTGLKEFFHNTKVNLTLASPTFSKNQNYYVILSMNLNHVAGFKIKRKEAVKFNDGVMELTLFEKRGLSWPKLFNFLFFGNKKKIKGITTLKIKDITLNFMEKVVPTLDGEKGRPSKVFHLSIVKEAIEIILPSSTIKKYFSKDFEEDNF